MFGDLHCQLLVEKVWMLYISPEIQKGISLLYLLYVKLRETGNIPQMKIKGSSNRTMKTGVLVGCSFHSGLIVEYKYIKNPESISHSLVKEILILTDKDKNYLLANVAT